MVRAAVLATRSPVRSVAGSVRAAMAVVMVIVMVQAPGLMQVEVLVPEPVRGVPVEALVLEPVPAVRNVAVRGVAARFCLHS